MIRRRHRAQRDRPEAIAALAPTLSGVLLCGLRRAVRQEPIVKSARVRLERMGLIKTQPGRFSALTPLGVKVLKASATIAPTPSPNPPPHPGKES